LPRRRSTASGQPGLCHPSPTADAGAQGLPRASAATNLDASPVRRLHKAALHRTWASAVRCGSRALCGARIARAWRHARSCTKSMVSSAACGRACPVNAQQVASHAQLKRSRRGRQGGRARGRGQERLDRFLCGLAAGMLAKLGTHPLDVAKKRFQARAPRPACAHTAERARSPAAAFVSAGAQRRMAWRVRWSCPLARRGVEGAAVPVQGRVLTACGRSHQLPRRRQDLDDWDVGR